VSYKLSRYSITRNAPARGDFSLKGVTAAQASPLGPPAAKWTTYRPITGLIHRRGRSKISCVRIANWRTTAIVANDEPPPFIRGQARHV